MDVRNGMKLAALVAGFAMLMLLLGAAPPVPYGTTEALNLIYSLFGQTKTVSDSIDTEVDRANTRLGNIRTHLDSLVELATPEDPEWITLVNGQTIPAAKHMTFSLPLSPMGTHDQVAFQIYCSTWPDTLWYQVVAANTPMDSLTVFNFGTTEAPNYVRYIVKADFEAEVTSACEYLDNAFSESWHPTGTDFNPSVGSYTFPVKDVAGLYAGAKYIGIRVGADVNSPVVGLKVILELK